MHCAVERKVLNHDQLSNGERRVTEKQARVLIDSGYYRLSSGFPFGATHYRRSLSDSSCLHMVIEDGQRRLHHDTFDPHASLSSLSMHLTHEAKSEAVTYFAAAWGLVRLLAR